MASHEKIIEDLIKKQAPELRDAFLLSINNMRNDVDLQEIIRHLEANNIEAAIEALKIEPKAYRIFEVAMSQTYEIGGNAIASAFPRLNTPLGKVVFRFDVSSPASERWLRTYSSDLITRITTDQKDAVRNHLSQAMFRGDNPRTAALDIVGRVDRFTQRRVGGVLGLSSPQERWVNNAKQQLLSGEPSEIRKYLNREARDRRFDATIKKALKEGKPIDKRTIDRAIGRYNDRLLKVRGDTIGRTEALTSLNKSQYDAYTQALETGGVKNITRIWDTSGRANRRDTHRAMEGQQRTKQEPFVSPSGARLRYPGDTSLGAGPEEVINCACRVRTKIDFLKDIQ